MKRFQFINPRAAFLSLGVAACVAVAGCSGRPEVAAQLGATAQEQLQNGQIELAKKTIDRAIRERDDMPELHILRGRIELAAKLNSNALDAYANALALDKVNMEALQAAAQLGLQTGRFQIAEDAGNRILALAPDDSNALLVLGLLRIVGHRPDKALEFADRILATAPDNEPATILKARALYLSKKPAEAMALIQKIIPASGPTEGESMTLLELHRENGDAQKMLEQFAALRKVRPENFELHADEANLHYKLGNLAAARPMVGLALLRAGDDLSRTRIAVSLLREYDRSPFTDDQLKTLSTKASAVGVIELARFYIDTKQPEKIGLLFPVATNDNAKGLLARAAIAEGRQKTGLALAEDVLARDKSQCDALLARAEFKLQARLADAAIIDSQLAQAQCPRIVGGWLILARAYAAKGDANGTRRVFEQAVDANPQDTLLAAEFARWLITRKEGQRAVSAIRRLVRVSPAAMSGWTTYKNVCAVIADDACLREAERGLVDAKRLFGADQPVDERPPAGLFGRLRKI
jgi:tetratricopeptide (TPR) repeat protein